MSLVFLFIGGWLSFFFPSPVSAQVFINEVHPQPKSGSDWVELFNLNPVEVSLQDWQIMDVLATPSVLHTFTHETIPPLGFLVLELSNKLNNGGDGVTLKDSSNQIADTMNYLNSTSNQSWSRELDGVGEFVMAEASRQIFNRSDILPDFPPPSPSPEPSLSPNPTPNPSPTPLSSASPSPNPTPPPSSLALYPQLTEVQACPPPSNPEWIELYNPHPTTISFSQWLVKDSSGHTRSLTGTLEPDQYQVFSWNSALLNNSGDKITLLTETQIPLITVELPACHSGQSYSYYQSQWQIAIPTPEAANLPSPDTESGAILGTTAVQVATATAQEIDNAENSGQRPPLPTFSYTIASNSSQVLGSRDQTQEILPSILNLSTPSPPKWPVIGVIMGGLLLISGSSYKVYESFHHLAPPLA